MASIFQNIKGIMGSLFQIGGPSGNQLKNQADGLAVRNSTDNAHQNLSVKQASGGSPSHAVNWQDFRDGSPLIQFSFDGASAPAAGSNAGAYGMCHTSGGSYSAGQVYYDNGTTLAPVKTYIGMSITTGSAISGTVSMNANGVYVAHSSAVPFTWTLKGDGAPNLTGFARQIRLALDTSASKSSTTPIPAGSKVSSVSTEIETAYDNGATIQVIVDGAVSDLTIQSTTENDPSTTGVYISEPVAQTVDADSEGLVKVVITGGPSAGSGELVVNFTNNFLN